MILYDNAFLPNWLLQGMFCIISRFVCPVLISSVQNDKKNQVFFFVFVFYWTVNLTDFIPTKMSESPWSPLT